MSDDLRALLDSIAYGDDAAIRPADRLKAAELLGQLPDGDTLCEQCQCPRCQVRHGLDDMSDEELAAFGAPLPRLDPNDPQVQQLIDERARQLAAQWLQQARPGRPPDTPEVVEVPPRRAIGQRPKAPRALPAAVPDEDGMVPLTPPPGIDMGRGWEPPRRGGAARRFLRRD